MPTPFYHLDLAESLLNHTDLPDSIRRSLLNQRGAFLLGNTAPDVQVLSRQRRQATHFFSFPFNPDATPPWENLRALYPILASLADTRESQAVFLAGYLCHLQADWYWVKDVFLPAFGPDLNWASFPQRLYLHNVLRAYLDRHVLPGLPVNIPQLLQSARPDHWLPFTADRFLFEWRDYLAKQLEPGARIETVEVFAARQGLSPEQFYRLIDSEDRMESQVFIHISRDLLHQYREGLIRSNLNLLVDYLSGDNHLPGGPYPARESFV